MESDNDLYNNQDNDEQDASEAEDAEDLDENVEADYQNIEALDRYEGEGIDDDQ